MSCWRHLLLAVCCTPALASSGEKAGAPFLAEVEALRREIDAEYKRIQSDFAPQFAAAKTPEDRKKVEAAFDRRYREEIGPRMNKVLTSVRPHAAKKAAAEPLSWWLTQNPAAVEALGVAELLVGHHVTNSHTLDAAIRQRHTPWAEIIFRAVSTADVPRDRKAAAIFRLALWLAAKSEFLADQEAMAAADPGYKPAEGDARLLDELRRQKRDAAAMEAEAVKGFKAVLESYADVKDLRGYMLADVAKSSLYALENLRVGKVAPDIEADDLDGRRFKLSENRGKVVVLVFWAAWCAPCMAQVPHERELAARMKDRPFVIIGVNGDPTKKAAQKAVADHKINWRSFWDSDGPVAKAWNVTSWPTVYVLDAKGVIHVRQVSGKTLDQHVDRLVKQLEQQQRREDRDGDDDSVALQSGGVTCSPR
jgi:peroxiredoxin